jgi:hypothetical protein
MNYVDTTLLKLADPAQRAGVFNDVGLAQMLSALYDTSTMQTSAPYSPIFDTFELGVPVARAAAFDGYWQSQDGSSRMDARFELTGLFDVSPIRVDALWQGRIVANVALAGSTLTAVGLRWPDAGTIDAQIVAALGSLPSDPVTLETQRRTRYMAELEASMKQPSALTDPIFDSLLASVGARSVGDVIAARGTANFAVGQITFSDPGQPRAAVDLLPVSAALMISDTGFSIADFLMQTKIVRTQLEPLGLGVSVDPKYPLRTQFLIVWVVPAAVFDDTGWPGASPDLRIAAAGTWLASEGIGLVVTA